MADLIAALTRELGRGYAVPFSPPRRPAEGLVGALPGLDPSTVVKETGPATTASP